VHEPEPAVIRAAMAGDSEAFAVLVRAYQVPVWSFLSRLLGDRTQAEDATQETFLRVYRSLPGFEFRSRFSTWLLQIARNTGLDALRSRARQDRLATRAAGAPRSPAVAGADSGSDLHAAVEALSPKLREALLAVEILGLSYREAAAVFAVPEGTVKSRVAQARRQVLAWLRVEDAVDEM
jgi:RNA polymerase sigma-70 factor (ECF subfamily)